MKALIMAGGKGTRFWPASRESRPKQFLNIAGKRTMLQETMARLDPLLAPDQMRIVCAQEFVKNVTVQAPGFDSKRIFVEPAARGTAASIGYAATRLRQDSGDDEVVVVLPADHVISNVPEFHRVLRAAEDLAREGWLVTYGISATHAATGYGYIERGKLIGVFHGRTAYQVKSFVEKPHRAKAAALVESGRHDWNSGMFVWTVGSILANIQEFMPELHGTLAQLQQNGSDSSREAELFEALEAVSIDVGVLEKASRVAVVPCDLGWSDVGNWRSLDNLLLEDQAGNYCNGDYVQIDSSGCIIQASHGKIVALVGVENLVVVETPDAVLVCDRERTEDVRQVVELLRRRGMTEYL